MANLFDGHLDKACPGSYFPWPGDTFPFKDKHNELENKISAKGRFTYPVLLRVRVDKECILAYTVETPESMDKSATDQQTLAPMERNPTLQECAGMSVCLRLPLFLATASRGGRRIVQVALPEKDVQFQCQSMNVAGKDSIPLKSAGSWFFKLRSRLEVGELLAQLQVGGCVMRNLEERYKIGKLVGVGASAKVFFATDRLTGDFAAIKITLQTDDNQGSRLGALALREAAILRWARHPSILQYRGVFETTDLSTGRFAWAIITEFISGGELFMKVKNNGPFCEPRARHVLTQLLSGIDFLHKRGLVHRDIKTENVILREAETDSIKLVDFGLATPEWDELSMQSACGSPGYIAPEVLRGEPYDCKVDCFSIGVLLYILLAGYGPFRGNTTEEMLLSNLRCRPSFKGTIANNSPEAMETLSRMLTSHPGARPTAEECLQMPWFQAPSTAAAPLSDLFSDKARGAGASSSSRTPSKNRMKRRIYSVELNYHEIFTQLVFDDSDLDDEEGDDGDGQSEKSSCPSDEDPQVEARGSAASSSGAAASSSAPARGSAVRQSQGSMASAVVNAARNAAAEIANAGARTRSSRGRASSSYAADSPFASVYSANGGGASSSTSAPHHVTRGGSSSSADVPPASPQGPSSSGTARAGSKGGLKVERSVGSSHANSVVAESPRLQGAHGVHWQDGGADDGSSDSPPSYDSEGSKARAGKPRKVRTPRNRRVKRGQQNAEDSDDSNNSVDLKQSLYRTLTPLWAKMQRHIADLRYGDASVPGSNPNIDSPKHWSLTRGKKEPGNELSLFFSSFHSCGPAFEEDESSEEEDAAGRRTRRARTANSTRTGSKAGDTSDTSRQPSKLTDGAAGAGALRGERRSTAPPAQRPAGSQFAPPAAAPAPPCTPLTHSVQSAQSADSVVSHQSRVSFIEPKADPQLLE
eukprot:TRINITY_DN7730_c0_g3_i2.p1 TRINITY_DN7730_c0_g3~~TRINITY_DN7730_c0_g3_i2.p1  ORF type:complete len:1032 (+),score=194.44 TRINITY_DN7730_c0_g3_i2:310-3096(+)